MQKELEINGRQYSVTYTTDTLISENRKYVDDVQATVRTPKGEVAVTKVKTLSLIHEILESEL